MEQVPHEVSRLIEVRLVGLLHIVGLWFVVGHMLVVRLQLEAGPPGWAGRRERAPGPGRAPAGQQSGRELTSDLKM